MARLLVTGGAGYVGSHTLRRLARAGHETVVLDDLSGGHRFLVGDAPLVQGDVCDPNVVSRVFDARGPFDAVLHFAALISVGESVEEPERYGRVNVGGTRNLLDAARTHGVGAFVLSSSAAVYGEPETQPIPEDAALAPVSPYGQTKLEAERAVEDSGLPWAALRYFNACGADPEGGLGECHDPETHLIPRALEALAGLRPSLRIFGSDWPTPDGTCVRDYVHATDLGEAHVLAVEALLAGRAVGARNVGTGRGHSVREVVDAAERVVGRPVPVEEAPRRPGDAPVLVADAARLRRELGWEPRHSDLDTILATAWAWLEHWTRVRRGAG
jgi:UDP-glucose-4-epimerase GalE